MTDAREDFHAAGNARHGALHWAEHVLSECVHAYVTTTAAQSGARAADCGFGRPQAAELARQILGEMLELGWTPPGDLITKEKPPCPEP